MSFRKLRADEIDCRVAMIRDNGLSLLLYKDARVDMRILDETVGADRWNRSHTLINGNLFCSVGIYIPERGEWVYKQDVGVESNTEKEKGQASDSFKRACFNWGIGRELYSAPFIWINSGDYETTKKSNGSPACKDSFAVAEIGYDDRGDINRLIIRNVNKKKTVYTFPQKREREKQEREDDEKTDLIGDIRDMLREKGYKETAPPLEERTLADLNDYFRRLKEAPSNRKEKKKDE